MPRVRAGRVLVRHHGYAIREALPDQIATLDEFDGLVGQPAMTIAWGHSLGGIITADVPFLGIRSRLGVDR